MRKDITLMDLHGGLSSLLFAVQEEIGRRGYARLTYSNDLYLQVSVDTYSKHTQALADIFSHGVLWGPFDYRFTCVSRPVQLDALDRCEVTAMVDLHNSKPPSGPVNYNETPRYYRERAMEYDWGWRR